MTAMLFPANDRTIRLPARPGTCRMCGCTEADACVGIPVRDGVFSNCWWADDTRTLCSNPACLERAGQSALVVPS